MKKIHIQKPIRRNGQYCVLITNGKSPITSEILEVIECGSRESAWETYRRVKKENGEGM